MCVRRGWREVLKAEVAVTEKGKVISIHEGKALVMLTPSEKCAGCNLCSQLQPGGKMSLEVEAVEGLNPGQEVTIEIDSREMLKGGWTVFILPLIAFIVGAVVAPEIVRVIGLKMPKDVASIILGGFLLGITFLGIYLRSRRPRARDKLAPRIVDFR
jgi:positive regulator of sigma E activity